MTALRMRARDFLNEDQLIAVRQRVTWKGVALIAHAWALILGSIALVAWWPNPLTFLLAVGIIGSRLLVVTRIGENYTRFRGAGAEFLATLPAFYRTR